MSALAVPVSAAVEGDTDRAALERLAAHVGLEIARVFVTNGKPRLLQRIEGYNEAARRAPWLVLVDLDNDATCAAALVQTILPEPSALMTCRIVVRSLESWLLADPAFARFFHVRARDLPADPDAVVRPKRMVVDLARQSSRPAIREAIVPRPGSGREVGPEYVGQMVHFIEQRWDPDRAAERSDSLRRCLARLREIPR